MGLIHLNTGQGWSWALVHDPPQEAKDQPLQGRVLLLSLRQNCLLGNLWVCHFS